MSGVKQTDPHVFVIFGGTGDLAARKLLPALYKLHLHGGLHPQSLVPGVSRDDFNDEAYRKWGLEALAREGFADHRVTEWVHTKLNYQPIGAGDERTFRLMGGRLAALEYQGGLEDGNRAFYLALPPVAFPGTIEGLGKADLNR